MLEDILIGIEPELAKFEDFVQKGDSLIMIYINTCGHCKSALKLLNKSKLFKSVGEEYGIKYGKIEFLSATRDSSDSSSFEEILFKPLTDNKDGFPIFAYFKDGVYANKVITLNEYEFNDFISEIKLLKSNFPLKKFANYIPKQELKLPQSSNPRLLSKIINLFRY